MTSSLRATTHRTVSTLTLLSSSSGRQPSIDLLFKGSASFSGTANNAYDVLIVDEAHRLVERSQYEPSGSNQIANIIRSARVSVFFIDEDQRVKYSDYGTVKRIKAFAKKAGAKIFEDELVSQFRCNGSDGYLSWLTDVLELRETANYDLEGIDYDFKVMDSPAELEQAIRAKNGDNKARIVAGYCWNWPKKTRLDSDYHDITIGNWSMSWNLDGGEPFAIGANSVNEAGCIHTVQGLEFEYVGVIIGPDMCYEDGHIVTDRKKRAKTDRSLDGIGRLPEAEAAAEADVIIKNTYRTLMTRGQRGCYVYCTDAALGEYLKKRLAVVEYDSVGK